MNDLFYMLHLSPALLPALVQQEYVAVSAYDWRDWRSEMRSPPSSSHRASHAFSQVNTLPPPSSFCVYLCKQTYQQWSWCAGWASPPGHCSAPPQRELREYMSGSCQTQWMSLEKHKRYTVMTSNRITIHIYYHRSFYKEQWRPKKQWQGNLMAFQKTSGYTYCHLWNIKMHCKEKLYLQIYDGGSPHLWWSYCKVTGSQLQPTA